MNRTQKSKGPQESLVTDQPGRKIFFAGLIISIILGFFLRGLTNPTFVQTELQAAVAHVHESTQISWSQAAISLRKGILPRFSILLSDVKIVSTEECWGQPLLYAHEVELPVSIVGFFENGQPLDRIVIRDSFLEMKSNFVCEKQSQPVKVQVPSRKGAIRLKSVSETKSRPPLVLREFEFENFKIRHPNWIFPDWQLQTLQIKIRENNPWYVEVDSEFLIPETEGVESRAQLNVQYKEFPTQRLDMAVQGRWREGTFKVKGQWAGPQAGWTFRSQFNYFPFQFLKNLAQKTKTPWNWPDKPMWFSFSSQTQEPFSEWKNSKHLVRELKVEGDLGELDIPDLQIQSWEPFKVQPFVFAIQNADISAGFNSRSISPTWLENWGTLSGQGQWLQEDEFRFQGQLKGPNVVLNYNNQKMTQNLPGAKVQADLNKGQWRILLSEWDVKESGPANLKVEGPQNLSSGRLTWTANDMVIPQAVLRFYNILSIDEKWSWKLSYNWKKQGSHDLSGVLSMPLLETRNLSFERPILSLKRRSSKSDEYQLTALQTTLREPFEFFTPELKGLSYPMKLGRLQVQWAEQSSKEARWVLNSSKMNSKGRVEEGQVLKGTLSVGGLIHTVIGTKESPLLRLNSRE